MVQSVQRISRVWTPVNMWEPWAHHSQPGQYPVMLSGHGGEIGGGGSADPPDAGAGG